MTIKGIEGLVIDLLDQKDYDIIASILTKDYGFIKVYVKGAKKVKNKSFYVFKELNLIEFDLNSFNPDGISSYKSGTIINVFDYTKLSLAQSGLVATIMELIMKISQTYEKNDAYYDSIKATIKLITPDNKAQTLALLNNVLLKTLAILGVPLQLKHCLECGNRQNRVVAFDIDLAGFICQEHYQADHQSINDKSILTYLFYLNKDNYDKLLDYEAYHQVVNQLLNKYLIENTGVYLNSLKYIF